MRARARARARGRARVSARRRAIEIGRAIATAKARAMAESDGFGHISKMQLTFQPYNDKRRETGWQSGNGASGTSNP